MVQEEISELLSESKSWKDSLVSYREKYVQSQKELLGVASTVSKDKLGELERFQNQFYIQLLNIHDVKKDVKSHIHHLTAQENIDTNESIKAEHEKLKLEYNNLVLALNQLKEEFETFSS